MNDIARQMIEEHIQQEREWKARHAEPVLQDWTYQKEIEMLLKSGFAVLDSTMTERWKRENWQAGRRYYYRAYTWTDAGREACFRCRHSTPMSWANDIYIGKARHCVVCGRDCYRKKVWASSRRGNMECVCMTCGSFGGHGLEAFEK